MEFITREIFRKLLDEILIFEVSYQTLCWSASQLRASSCWYIARNPEIKKTDVIWGLGDFSGVRPAAKKAARIG
jgi:hypothetical protein